MSGIENAHEDIGIFPIVECHRITDDDLDDPDQTDEKGADHGLCSKDRAKSSKSDHHDSWDDPREMQVEYAAERGKVHTDE